MRVLRPIVASETLLMSAGQPRPGPCLAEEQDREAGAATRRLSTRPDTHL
jgi:hypothetical protein